MERAPYLCLLKQSSSDVSLPSAQTELTLQSARTMKSETIWTSRVSSEHHATILTVVHSGDHLHFEMSVFEPVLEKLHLEYKLDGKLVDLTIQADMSLHMLMKYADLHAYQRIQLILNTYGNTTLQVVESYDVTLCEDQRRDLKLEHIAVNQGLVVTWGQKNLVTYCSKSQE